MERKPCSRCSAPAEFSLLLVLSTVGITPRAQKCSHSLLLCKSCLQASVASQALTPIPDLQERLSDVLTRLAEHRGEPVEYKNAWVAVEEVHQCNLTDASSRPCLIAGNSRKSTSPTERKKGEAE